MIQSLMDTQVWNEEFRLIRDQEHFEKVWSIMQKVLMKYVKQYIDNIALSGPFTAMSNYSLFLQKLINNNGKLNEKYHIIFDLDMMDEYGEAVEDFKNHILKKETDVIKNGLLSKSEALNEWKSKFYSVKAQKIYDTFYNIMDFANDYDEEFDENVMSTINKIDENKLVEMENGACYLNGVIGYGILSNILKHMYPRVFPGNYKAGIYSLHFLTGDYKKEGIDMPSETSEFLMVKDLTYTKTNIIEAEHNYFYPFETFGLYTLRIYRVIEEEIKKRFEMQYPTDYRFLITNDFYDFVTMLNKEAITNLTGNDDILKFGTIL